MPNKLKELKSLSNLVKKLKSQGKRVVFAYGTFDLIHSGHAAYLLKARLEGDILIVGVISNKSRRETKGKGFPLIDQKNRAELINYFKFVDYTIYIDEGKIHKILDLLKPDIFYSLESDWGKSLHDDTDGKLVQSYGGKVLKVPKSTPFFSSSQIVDQIADLKIKEIIEYFFGKIQIDLTKGDWETKKFSGLKTNVRSEALYFGDHLKELERFRSNYYGELVQRNEVKKLGNKLRKSGKKIVLTSGACDLVHAGHARFYKKARSLGDILVLAIPANKVITKQKGRGRPVVDEKSRAEIMLCFEFIDYAVIFEEDTVIPVLEDLQPDIFFTVQEEWNEEANNTANKRVLGKWQGKVVSVPPQSPKLSSSKLIKRAAGRRVKEVFREVLEAVESGGILKD